MQYDAAAGGNLPAHAGEALLQLVPDAARLSPCRVENWARLPACHFTQADHWRLRNRVRDLTRDPEVAGVVVTHGTDTLEETAYLLDRTLDGEVPVVVTGAMRTSDHAEWDGGRNLGDAIRVAASSASRGRGAHVVFGGQVWQGCQAVKVDTMALNAFGAPFGEPVGSASPQVRYGRPVPHRAVVQPPNLDAQVALVPMVVGDGGQLLDAARAGNAGVVIEAFGSGNLPPGAVPAIGRWLREGKPVVLSSRCASGQVSPDYAFDGGGANTVAMGVVPAGPRTPSQARWELVIALSAGVPYAAGLAE